MFEIPLMLTRRLIRYAAVMVCACILPAWFCVSESKAAEKPRIIATTDGEIDDRCSMVRFLLYTNEWDIEGIIISSSEFHWKGHDWAGVKWIDEDIDLYAKSYENLKKHDPNFPSPEELKKLVYVGNIDNVGEMKKDTPGSDRIVEVLLDDKPGPVYLQAWGGTNTIARALWKIQHEYPEQMNKVSEKAIIYIILDQDETFREYIQPNWPKLQVLGSFRQFETVAYGWEEVIPQAQHQYYDADWMKKNILNSHGPLCASYEAEDDGRFRSEGDTPAFWHQIDVGLRSMEHPSYGGWGGRFVKEKKAKNVWRGAKDDGSYSKPLWRWSKAFQNDWAARADWCVKDYEHANHPPVVKLAHAPDLKAKPGQTVKLSAKGKDPDGDKLYYKWWYYKEPSTFSDDVRIDNADADEASFAVPYDSQDNEFHIILTVRDNGSPNLFAYRRVIVQSPAVFDKTPPSSPEGLKATAVSETHVSLTWKSAKDQESGIRRYIIYRDGVRVAECKSTPFTDTGLSEDTKYAYQISAVNGCSMVGPKSPSVRIATPPDQTPPAIKSVLGAGRRIKVGFNEPVERASAENIGNYAIDGGVSLSAASLAGDKRIVTLMASTISDGETYSLSIRGVRDSAKVPNTMNPDTRTFTHRIVVPLVSVGVADGETPLAFHGTAKHENDGSLLFVEGEPWGWVIVGEDEKPLATMEALQSFTILGWAKATSLETGSGGNRFVFNLNHNRSGIDLVHHGDGRMRLAVNEWPDGVRNDSSPGKIQVGKWVFFAVSYDCTKTGDNVCWYFGDEDTPAELDRTTNYNNGPVDKGSSDLAIGNFNKTLQGAGLDRQFRGWLRGITIFGSHTDSRGALNLEAIRLYQDTFK